MSGHTDYCEDGDVASFLPHLGGEDGVSCICLCGECQDDSNPDGEDCICPDCNTARHGHEPRGQ